MNEPILPPDSTPPPSFPDFIPFTVQQPLVPPSDTFSVSLASTLPPPITDASQPQIPIATFYGSVSSANLKLVLQDYINRITDPLLRQALMQAAQDSAAAAAAIITLIVRYQTLERHLQDLDLPTKKNNINNAINAFNAAGGNDATEISAMNAAINAYNAAQTNYQNALTTYNGALSNFSSAQGTYDAALQVWNTALDAYSNGSITQSQLQTAEGIFNTALAAYNSAKTTFAGATSTFNTSKTAWENAQSDLTAAQTDYNAYVALRNAPLSGPPFSQWNSSAQNARSFLIEMNGILDTLGLATLPTPSDFNNFGLPDFDQGSPGPDTLRALVQGTLDGVNGNVGSLNALITLVTNEINTINGGGYTPPLVAPPSQSLVPNLPTAQSNYSLSPIVYIPPSPITFNVPPAADLITTYLEPLIVILNNYGKLTQQETVFQSDVTDPRFLRHLTGKFNTVGSLGSSTTITALSSQGGPPQSPHLAGILSRQAFEAFFNVYGVPIGSPLVDQIGALVNRVENVLGLLSAGPAQQILEGGRPISGEAGIGAVNAAIALGNLQQVQNLAESGQITAAVTAIVENDATLVNLTPQAKAELIQNLSQEVLSSLFKSALNLVAISIGIPGLVPQILSQLPQIASAENVPQDQTAAKLNQLQLFLEVILSKELSTELNISSTVAQKLARDALEQENAIKLAIAGNIAPDIEARDAVVAEEVAADQRNIEVLNRENVVSSIVNQLRAQGIVADGIEQQVIIAVANTEAAINAEIIRSAEIKRDAFLNSLSAFLESQNVDPLQAGRLLDKYRPTLLNALVGGLIKPSFFTALANNLITDFRFREVEANLGINQALSAAQIQANGAVNPLSSFLGGAVESIPALSGLFKVQMTNFLTPVVGTKKATDVAEDYGRLIFSAPNSIMQVLGNHERNLNELESYNSDRRIYEDYRNATEGYINPLTAETSPIHLGKTLLMSGMGGGLSMQGTTSVDNTLGPSGYRSKHSTDFPGILG